MNAVPPEIEELERDPRSFSFFRAVWMLERALPDAPRVGGTEPAREERVRLRPSTSLAFPAADVERIERIEGDEGTRWRLTTPLLGLYGVTSPLPCFYTEDILHEEIREEEDPARLFLDVVNHRLLSLLYRAWSKYRWDFTYQEGADHTSRLLLGWLGLGTAEQQAVVDLPIERLLRYAGAITQRPRSATLVAGVMADWFDVPVRLEQCVERRVALSPDDRNRLGVASCSPGEDLVLGERVVDRAGQCRIEIGPVPFDGWEGLRPGGEQHATLCALASFLLPDALAFDLRLRVAPDTIPALQLTSGEDARRLGWSTWLGGAPGRAPESDVIFQAATAPRTLGAP